MTEFINLLLQILQYVWPFRIVWAWERGVVYIFGQHGKKLWWRFGPVVGPGIYPVIPYFMEIKTDAVVSDVVTLPTQTIELQDGSSLTFSATVTLEVLDLDAAYNRVVYWQSAASELAAAILAERLAGEDRERLSPNNRGRLIGGYLVALNNQLRAIGVAATTLRFNNFVRGMRVYRLIQENHYQNAGGSDD